MILNSSITELKRRSTPTNRTADASTQTHDTTNADTEYTDMGVQVDLCPSEDQDTQTDNSPCITGFHTTLFPDLDNEHVIASRGIPETPWENEIRPI